MTATLNGKPTRKQLADQLDRLDGIIDLLADALPQAVADACKEGARQAMLELLSNPDVRALLAGGRATAPPPPPLSDSPPPTDPKPSWWTRLKAKVGELKSAVAERSREVVTSVVSTAQLLATVLPWKRIALVAGVVGVTVGLVSLFCPPLVAAAVSAIGGAVTAIAAQVTGVLRKVGLLATAADSA